MNPIQSETKLKELMATVFNVKPSDITDRSTPDTLENWDSVNHLNLILALEETFAIELTEDESVEILSVPLIKLVLQEHGVVFEKE